MFHTLRYTKSPEALCSFQSTSPPFSRKREGTLAKVACTNCRLSKLKCSSDPNGCQRCLAKRLDCFYRAPVRGNSEKKVSSSHETTRETTPAAVTVEASTGDEFLVDQEPTYSSSLHDSSPEFDIVDFSSTAENIRTALPVSEFTEQWQNESYTFTDEANNTHRSGIPGLEMIDFSFNNESCPVLPSPSASQSNCHCIVQAVATYESIEVAVWGQRKLFSDLDDMLQLQKAALAECEKLVECPNCNVQPAYIMLLLSMCRKILRTLEDIYSISGEDCKPAIVDQDSRDKKRPRFSDEDDEERGARRQAFDGSTDNWKLDDEDKRLVLQSLLSARVAKLNHLLGMLDKVVNDNTWPVHKDLVRELQNRLAGGLLS
ncbi:hypothetical protein F5884DRAFT_869748 [Xylogone sp. PMI_703]|nr:hypothetical protein F5884DRAFT_869748 [Xylogone sp. PMI_703]